MGLDLGERFECSFAARPWAQDMGYTCVIAQFSGSCTMLIDIATYSFAPYKPVGCFLFSCIVKRNNTCFG